MSARSVAVCLLAVIAAAVASAEVHVWSSPDVEIWNDYPVAFPTVLENVVSVELHMAGNTGASRGSCDTPGGGEYYEQPWAISIVLEGAAVAQVTTGGGAADRDYEVLVPFELAEGQADWSFLEDGVTVASFEAAGIQLPMPWPFCMTLVPRYPTTEVFEIIVTTGSVAAEGVTWSAIKARYR